MKIAVALHFPKGYIAHPYWPEREKLINIQKESGVSFQKSDAKRAAVMKAYLDKKGLTPADYQALEALAAREFYRAADIGLDGADPSEIVLPPLQLNAMMAHAADICPANVRLAPKEQIRTVADFGAFRTGRTKADGIWERFARMREVSNQPGFRRNEFISDFTAKGTFVLFVDAKDISKRAKDFFVWAGLNVGVGASKKMGWGRFTITEWEVVP